MQVGSQESLLATTFNFGTQSEKSYRESGFVCWENFLHADAIDLLQKAFDAVLAECDPEIDKEWIMNIHQLLPAEKNWVWRLSIEPKLVRAVRRCLKSDRVTLYCSQLAYRHPGSKVFTPWHQVGSSVLL